MNLFLVTSPFQYICANEALLKYKTKKNILVIITSSNLTEIEQLDKVVEESNWDFVIKTTEKNRAFSIPKLIRKIKKILNQKRIEKFFFAEYVNWCANLIINNLNIDSLVFFDDGTATIYEYELYIKPLKPYIRKRLINDFLLKLQGVKPTYNVTKNIPLEVFTIFDIETTKHKIIKNTLSKLQASNSLYNKDAAIGFIGEGGIGGKSEKTLREYILELNNYRKKFDRPIVYFPHRTEFEEVANAVKEIPNLIYHKSELPLEIELFNLANQGTQLSGLIGILSTAMYSSIILYPNMPIYNLNNVEKMLHHKLDGDLKYSIIHNEFLKKGIKDMDI